MTLSLEQLATILGLVVGAMAVGRVLVHVGEAKKELADLRERHAELARESRQRLQALERHAPAPCPPTDKG